MSLGQNVLVIGSGISGLLHIQAALAMGAGRVAATDINDYRIKAAERFGAGLAMKADEDVPARLREFNNGLLADLVIVCAGATSAMTQAFSSVERGGTILFFAPAEPDTSIALPLWDVWRDGVKLVTSYAGPPADLLLAIEMMRAGKLNVRDMITHRLGLDETGYGFELVAGGTNSIKVIINPQR